MKAVAATKSRGSSTLVWPSHEYGRSQLFSTGSFSLSIVMPLAGHAFAFEPFESGCARSGATIWGNWSFCGPSTGTKLHTTSYNKYLSPIIAECRQRLQIKDSLDDGLPRRHLRLEFANVAHGGKKGGRVLERLKRLERKRNPLCTGTKSFSF